MIQRSRVRISSPFISSGIFTIKNEEDMNYIYTSNPKGSRLRDLIEYIIYLGALNINISFWLS